MSTENPGKLSTGGRPTKAKWPSIHIARTATTSSTVSRTKPFETNYIALVSGKLLVNLSVVSQATRAARTGKIGDGKVLVKSKMAVETPA